MNVLITGSNGFIGKEFSRTKKFRFRHVVRSKGHQNLNQKNIFYVDGINRNTNWNGAFENIDVVVHLAGYTPNKKTTLSEYLEVNTYGTVHLAKEAIKANVKRFVFLSSINVNGEETIGEGFSELETPQPKSPYAISKHKAEILLKDLKSDMEMVIVRPPLVYGKGVKGNLGMLLKIIKILPILPFGAVRNKLSLISNSNLADFLCLCVTDKKAANQTFVIADSTQISTKQLINDIGNSMNKKIIQLRLPPKLIKYFLNIIGQRKVGNRLLNDLVINIDKAKSVFGWNKPSEVECSFRQLKNEEH